MGAAEPTHRRLWAVGETRGRSRGTAKYPGLSSALRPSWAFAIGLGGLVGATRAWRQTLRPGRARKARKVSRPTTAGQPLRLCSAIWSGLMFHTASPLLFKECNAAKTKKHRRRPTAACAGPWT